MTFPIQFPFSFSKGALGSGLPVTGWWPDIHTDFALSVPPNLGSSAIVPPHISLSVPPSLAFTASGKSAAGFALSVPPSLAGGAAVKQPGAFGLSLPPTLGFGAAAKAAAGFALSIPPAFASTAAMTQPGAFGLSLPPILRFTGAPIPLYDSSAKSSKQSALASGTPFTWSSVGGTAGAYGIVFVNCINGAMDLGATAAVTWGGVTMTSLGHAYNDSLATAGWGWVFVLNGIPSGAQTISVTLTQSGKTFTGWGSSYSYNNVSSVGTLQTAAGSSTSPAVAVTAANATDIVWGAISGITSGTPSAFSLTQRQTSSGAPSFIGGDTTGLTSVTVSATLSSQVWSAFGLDLQ